MSIDFATRVYGAWAGKCLGGAIGMAYEGVPYQPQMTANSINIMDVPNDDLELQLVWLLGLERHGVKLSYSDLANFWKKDIQHGCDEYSVAIHNIKHGIMPPESGKCDNFFRDGMGATIRSEVWALAFANRPDAACHFAEMDASVDHWGDGVWAEIFMANVECKILSGASIKDAIIIATCEIPTNSRLRSALDLIIDLDKNQIDENEAKTKIINALYHQNFTDCVMNVGFIVFALLWGNGEFIKTILLTVNCGRDTDCTAASCGAILGMAFGATIMPDELLGKLSDKLFLSPNIEAIAGVPLTLTDLVKRTIEVQQKLSKELPVAKYPLYRPELVKDVTPVGKSTWLLLDSLSNAEVMEIKKALNELGRAPEYLNASKVTFDGLNMNLSKYAANAKTIDLLAFLEVDASNEVAANAVLSATADVGMTLWIDEQRVFNHHSRQLSLPSFHRAEGGAAIAMPLKHGDRKLFHIRLYSCLPPLICTVMFGNLFNDHLDGFRFDV